MDKRWQELADDDQGLPQYIGPGESFYQTIRGHQTIINKLDRNLRDLEKQFDDDCGPPPPPVQNCPVKNTIPNWVKDLGAAAAVTAVVVCVAAEPCGVVVVGGGLVGGMAAAQ